MTIKNKLTLRNLFILLCAALLALIAVKAYYIQQKITWITEAERAYMKKDLIHAEEWYQKARSNRWIKYKEDEIHTRLAQLAPITEIRSRLAGLDEAAQSASPDSDEDFTRLVQAYADLSALRNKYMKTGGQYSSYYKQISSAFKVTDHFLGKFKQFEQRFTSQMNDNLEKRTYQDESFRNKLLLIPEAYYGGKDKRLDSLSAAFKKYDTRKLTQLSADGMFTSMLNEALSMKNIYKEAGVESPWIKKTTESLADQVLRTDLKTENYTAFASHARDFVAFAQSAKVRSPLTAYISTQYSRLIRKAKLMVARGEYQQAIALYEAVAGYRDTSDQIAAAKLAWTKADPIRLLQAADSSKRYAHVIGGSGRYGAQLYAAASDDTGRIYYAAMDAAGQTRMVSSSELLQGQRITGLSFEKQLSTSTMPVILVEAESSLRRAYYSAFAVEEGEFSKLFEFEADGYQVMKDGTLLVNNPEGDGEGESAVYAWTGSDYKYQKPVESDSEPGSESESESESEYKNIRIEDLLQHAGQKVRFTCSIVSITDSGPLAQLGDSYVLLKSDSLLSVGNVTISGTLASQNEDVTLGQTALSLPVFEVTLVEE
ncbi:hypothetical protein [Paenibacillus sp. YPG26]|uniref:hypothetical protein n=1 Tax=Paenibacillus sp. YPG26 TaxID=2878915 RepID=UPI002040B14C|nr:hypothetical protein [Paenibacillus sp. YPG26]USB33626.1 hypothetical protein LDO05_02025 [Paenibacillus sp. YPG26]